VLRQPPLPRLGAMLSMPWWSYFPACSSDLRSGYESWFRQAAAAVLSLEIHSGDYWRRFYVIASDSMAVGLPLGRCSASGVGSSCALPQVVCP
jgi:hypothetical protein